MIAKELRALLPVWAAAAAVMVAAALIRDLRPFTVPVYFVGTVLLGALTIGHEYSNRTLEVMLTLPISRARILLSKLSVLAVLLLALLLLSTVTLTVGKGEATSGQAIRWLPVAAAMFITPYLTLAARSPMAGAVFTLGIAGMLLVAGEWIGILLYGPYTADVESFRFAFLSRMLLLLSAAGGVMTWWTFARLQVVDGPKTEIDFAKFTPGAAASSVVTRHSPTWLLIRKELRFQQLAFVMAAIYVVIYLVIVSRTRGMFSENDIAFALSVLYAGLLAVLIGSVASAEERNLRTLDAQLLLPMRTSRQWLVKVATVFGLTLLLTIVLPLVLAIVFPPERILWARTLNAMVTVSSALVVLAVAAVSLYVSTLCSSGVWAMMMSAPAAFAVALFVMKLAEIVRGVLYRLDGTPNARILEWFTALVTVGVIALVLRLAFANHRSSDRSRRRPIAHAALMAGAMTVGAALVFVTGALSR